MSIVEELIKEGVDINLSDGYLILLDVVFCGGSLEIVEKFIRELLIVMNNVKKNCVLLIVCFWGFVVVVKELIKRGVNINFSDVNYIFLIVVCVFGYI